MILSRKNNILLIVQLLFVAGLATIMSWQYIDKPPMYDEFYHILAAKNYIDHGEFSIHEGVYARASIYTWLVSKSIYYFGDSLISARIPAYVAGVILICAVFLWARRTFDSVTALIAAVLLSVSPILVSAMQFSRFYTLHALVFFLFFVCFYNLLAHTGRWGLKHAVLVVIGAILFVASCHFQITTLIGAMFLGLYGLLLVSLRYFDMQVINRCKAVVGVLMILGAVLLLLFYSQLKEIFSMLTTYPLWAKDNVNNYLYYLYKLKGDYPLLISVYPALLIISLYLRPKETLCFAVVFIFSLMLHSYAAIKSERYIIYLLPMYLLSVAVALSFLIKSLYKLLLKLFDNTFSLMPFEKNEKVTHVLASLGMVVTLLYISMSMETIKSMPVMLLSDKYADPYSAYYNNPEWRGVIGELQQAESRADVVISSAGVKALYYLGRLDYDLNASVHNEVGIEEFAIDGRTGVEVISNKLSLQKIQESNHSGLIIFEAGHLNNDSYVPKDVVEYVETYMESIPMPLSSRVHVYKWDKG